jgi:hypothetical protein
MLVVSKENRMSKLAKHIKYKFGVNKDKTHYYLSRTYVDTVEIVDTWNYHTYSEGMALVNSDRIVGREVRQYDPGTKFTYKVRKEKTNAATKPK